MARRGKHPLKQRVPAPPKAPPRLTVGLITHVPDVLGYWGQSLGVLRVCVRSLRESVREPFHLAVFDNASCASLRDQLTRWLDEGVVDELVLSGSNVGKIGGLDSLISRARTPLFAYADCDVLFFRGWLERSVEILDTFSEAAKVTALPIVGGDCTRLSHRAYSLAVIDEATRVEVGEIVPDELVESHRASLGEGSAEYQRRLAGRADVLLERGGVRALLSGADFQFTARSASLKEILPLQQPSDDSAYDAIYSPVIERKLDELGRWILSTPDYLVHHMGNRFPDLAEELPWRDNAAEMELLEGEDEGDRHESGGRYASMTRRIARSRRVRRWLRELHAWTFRLLYE